MLHEIGEISIYPTITSDFINVNFASSIGGEHNYQIYDVTGKLLFVGASNASTNQQTYRINVSNLAGGWYLIKFVSNNSLIATNKFLIK